MRICFVYIASVAGGVLGVEESWCVVVVGAVWIACFPVSLLSGNWLDRLASMRFQSRFSNTSGSVARVAHKQIMAIAS
ncbi:hypothetical protein QBC39DRAFT_364188 [Podospora conica]|nr:hypothetical protein QBC39DRAFT_364188 [Schizothecium conicum]